MLKAGLIKKKTSTHVHIKCSYLHVHGVETVEQQQYERIEHLQDRGLRRRHSGFLQTQVEQLKNIQITSETRNVLYC